MEKRLSEHSRKNPIFISVSFILSKQYVIGAILYALLRHADYAQ